MPKPTLMVYNKTTVCPTMDEEHCIIAGSVKLRSSNEPQIKRRYNVFFMSVAPAGILSRPRAHRSRVGLRWFGNDAAKIQRKNEMTHFFSFRLPKVCLYVTFLAVHNNGYLLKTEAVTTPVRCN